MNLPNVSIIEFKYESGAVELIIGQQKMFSFMRFIFSLWSGVFLPQGVC